MVVIEGLSFGYRRSEPIIAGLDFTFPARTVVGVTGPSGRGKSTLLYLIGLMLTPWAGRIAVGDARSASTLSDLERSKLRAARIGFVFQDAILDPSRTILDNVTEAALYAGLRRREARSRAERLLEEFGVRLRSDHRPGEVSGGQAQRVALCRALLNQPAVVLADEPTGNLDAESATVVIGALRDAAHTGGSAVIIASHDPRILQSCDTVLKL